MDVSVKGSRVIITGAAAGIGAVMAQRFMDEGARVHILDADGDALDRFASEHPGVTASLCDASDPDAVCRAFEESQAALEGVDVLINNVGIKGPTALIEDIEPADWKHCIEVNTGGHFYLTRLCVPLMKRQRSGSVVFMSSVAGRLGFPTRAPYATAKWGLVGLTQSLAMELGPHNIRVNAILPGAVAGARNEQVLERAAREAGIGIEEMRTRTKKSNSMRVFVSPEEVADLVIFLISPRAPHLSGQSIGVCGNYETLADS